MKYKFKVGDIVTIMHGHMMETEYRIIRCYKSPAGSNVYSLKYNENVIRSSEIQIIESNLCLTLKCRLQKVINEV